MFELHFCFTCVRVVQPCILIFKTLKQIFDQQHETNSNNLAFECWPPYPFDRRDAFNIERESSMWKYFTKKDDLMATCNMCHKDYSYRGSIGNLQKHWERKHGGKLSVSNRTSMSDDTFYDSDEEQEKAVAQITQKEKKPMATWNYFTVTDSDKFEATCKVCDKTVSYESVSELTQHLRDHGESPKDTDDEDYVPEVRQKLFKRKFKSNVWNYFKPIDEKMAVCSLCKSLLNFASSISNLRKHLQRKHKEVDMTPNSSFQAKRIYLNGELYEIANENEQKEEEMYEDVETLDMDPIYLSNDSLDKLTTQSPKKKQPKLAPKRNSSKITEEQVHSTRDTCYEEREVPVPRKEIPPKNMGSIDYFGQYVVSLLKELPKSVSDQLQSEIIKQILSSKMALNSQTAVNTYDVKISQNNKSQTSIPEPVIYTVVQADEAVEKTNVVTGNVVQE